MKTPTSTLQALIDTDTGTQPTYIVRIDWPTPKYYSMYPDAACDANPITQLKNISSAALQVNASVTSNVDSIRAVLADTDGTLLTDYKTYGVKGRTAAVYLTYIGEDTADFLTVVDGKITGDVTWDTDDNSLYIEITTRFDDALIGYSTNTLPDMHHEAKDKAWPLVFGAPLRVPALHIKRRPTAFLSSGINQNISSFKLTDVEDFPTGSPITIEIDSLRMTGTVGSDGQFAVATMNDAKHTSVGIADRKTDDPSYNDASVFWLENDDISIEGLFCYVNAGGNFQMVNYCTQQRGTKCHFAAPWGVQRPWSSSTPLPEDFLEPIRLSDSHTIAEVAAVPRASWPAGYRQGTSNPHSLLFSFTSGYYDVIPAYDQFGFKVDKEAFSIKSGAPAHLVVSYDDLYICNLVESIDLLEVWGEVDDEEVGMRPIPSSYYDLNLANTVDSGAAGATATMTVDGAFDLTVGNYFTLTDTSGSSIQFAFQNNNTYDGTKYSGDLIIGIADVNGDVGDVVDRIRTVINIQTDVDITAGGLSNSATVVLTQDDVGEDGNTAISNATVGLSSTNFTGGVEGDAVDNKTCTTLEMSTPLVARIGEKWTGKIWTTVVSANGSNGVDALRHLIDTYSIYTDDATTFDATAAKVNGWPVNFALLEKVPFLSTLREIAFQLRVGLIFRGSTILIKYISESINAQHSLTDAEIIDEGMVFNNDTSLTRATRLKATWQLDYTGRKNYQRESIYENNIDTQLLEEEFNFYIYNIKVLVDKTLAFWGYRFSNLWYSIELKAPLSSAVLEAFDIIDVNTGDFSIHTVRGEVQKVNIDTTTNLVSIRTLMASKPGADSYGMKIVNTGTKTFCVEGHQLHIFSNGDSITVADSTGNDGTYTINGIPVYNTATGYTCMFVAETVSSPIADGYIVPAPTTHPAEDPNLFTGDPADPIVEEPGILVDPTTGLNPATHFEPEPTDVFPDGGSEGGGGDGSGKQYVIIIEKQPPGTVHRGVDFELEIKITDLSGERINRLKTITFNLKANDDDDDVISPANYSSYNGEYEPKMVLNGGSSNYENAVIEISANDAETISTNPFKIRDTALTTLRFDAHPTTVTRGTDFTVSIAGGGDGNTFDVVFSATDAIGDRLYDAAGLVTQVVVNSSGDFDTTTWQVREGFYNGTMTVTLIDPDNEYEPATFTCALVGPVVATVTHDVGFQQSKIEADAPDSDFRKLVVTACPASITGTDPSGLEDVNYFTLSLELQDSSGNVQETMNAADNGYVWITWSDLIGDNEVGSRQVDPAVPEYAINFGDAVNPFHGQYKSPINSPSFSLIKLYQGKWSSTTNYIMVSKFEELSDPITIRFEYQVLLTSGHLSDYGQYYSQNSGFKGPTTTCVSPKVSSTGTLEQIIYERQLAAGIGSFYLIDPDVEISTADAKTAIDGLAVRYLRENDWAGGADYPVANSTLYSDTVAETREALANLALTCKYTINYHDPSSGGEGLPVLFLSEGWFGEAARGTGHTLEENQPDIVYLEALDNWEDGATFSFASETNDYSTSGSATGQQKAVHGMASYYAPFQLYYAKILSYGTQIDIARTAGTPIDTYRRKNRFFAKTALPSPKFGGSYSPTYRPVNGRVYDRAGQEWLPAAVDYWGILHEDEAWLDLVPSGAVTDTAPDKMTDVGTYGHAEFAGSLPVPTFDYPIPPIWDDYNVSVVGWILATPVCLTEWEFQYTEWDTDDT